MIRRCIYCGDPATDRDHVIPVAWKAAPRHYDCHTVPSCADCNQKILRDRLIFTVEERAEFVLKELSKRLAKVLDGWSGEGLSPEVADLAIRVEHAKELAKGRYAP